MGGVVSFVNYRPPARYDAEPWTEARIEEASEEGGDFSLIDTFAFSPVDADPTDPAARSFTTQSGTAPDYWYRVVYADGDGDTSPATAPFQSVADALSPPVVAAYASTDELFRVLRIRQPSTDQTEAGQRVLDAAALEIDAELGRTWDASAVPALVVEVNLERAVEHWQQQESPFGIIGLGDVAPIEASANTWWRHAAKLAPLKQSWGVA